MEKAATARHWCLVVLAFRGGLFSEELEEILLQILAPCVKDLGQRHKNETYDVSVGLSYLAYLFFCLFVRFLVLSHSRWMICCFGSVR
jgi:hypothetical protein